MPAGHGDGPEPGYIPGFVVDIYGSDEQREKYVRPMIEGKYISAISVTEPDSGSDLMSLKTRMEDGGDRYVVNGSKVFTTNAGYADFYALLAKDVDRQSIMMIDRDLIEKNGRGRFEINDLGRKMGINTTTSGELVFNDFEIPKNNVLGQRGKGLRMVLDGFELGRIVIAAQAFGAMLYGYEKTVGYAKKRQQFGQPIIRFQSVEHDSWTCTRSRSAAISPQGSLALRQQGPGIEEVLLLVKLAIPECAIKVLNRTIDILSTATCATRDLREL